MNCKNFILKKQLTFMDYLDLYKELLDFSFERRRVLVEHDVNVDLLHVIDEKGLRKALSSFQRGYDDNKVVTEMIDRIIEIASTSGGEIMIDDHRESFNNFKPFLQKNSKRILFTLGGNAGNASIALARLGADPFISTAIRNDKYGRWIKAYLEENQVHTDLLSILEGNREEAMTYGVEIPGKDRGFLNDSSDVREFKPPDIEDRSFDCVLLLGLHKLKYGFDSTLDFSKKMHQKSIMISDGGDYSSLSSKNMECLLEIFREMDLCCMNENELKYCLNALGIGPKEEKRFEDVLENGISFKEALGLNTLNIHTEFYSFDILEDRVAVLPTLEPQKIVVKTGIGDGYVAGNVFGFLQDGKDLVERSLRGLALGNITALIKLEKGDFPPMKELKRREMKIKEIGEKMIRDFIKESRMDENELIIRI